MTNNLSVRHLRAFSQIAGCGSFTRAAESLHLTQSTLTATIKQLEQQLGLSLLDRTTRRVLLTSEGERFLPVAERLLSDFDTAITDLQARAEHQQGQVGIAASPSVLTRLLPAVVHQYNQQFPNIGLYLRDDGAGGIEQRVLDNEVDFGIAGNHSNHPDLSYQPLLKDRYGIVVPADHPLSQAPAAIDWQQLRHERLIYLSSDTGIRAQLSAVKVEDEVVLPLDGALLEVSNPAVLAALIEQRVGISILPALAAATPSFNNLYFRPLVRPLVEREVFILTRRGRSLSPAAQTMRDLLLNSISDASLPPYVSCQLNS